MAKPYVGEIRLFASVTPPAGWLPCDGTLLSVGSYPLLAKAIGYAFGGFGPNFNLPDLQGRVPLHYAGGYPFASKGGYAQVQLAVPALPTHTHSLRASNQQGTSVVPTGNVLAAAPAASPFYQPADANAAAMDSRQIGSTGGNGGHENMAPYVALQFCIAADNVT
ncbi:MAG TPA: tail fiber protein [Rudaea sp.]|nr:tail fiber protein [Rudaea sp.]